MSRSGTSISPVNKYQYHVRFCLTFVGQLVNIRSRIRGAGLLAACLRRYAPALSPSNSRKRIGELAHTFQVWSRHSWPSRANEGLRVFSPNPRSAGLQRGAHLSTRKTTPLSGSCFERRLSVAGYPHSETPSFGERQPPLKKDERYGGGVS